MKPLFIISWCLVIWGISACDYVEGLHHEGEQVNIEIALGDFNTINVKTPIKLILEQSPGKIATLSGLDFRIENIDFTIDNGELVISPLDNVYSREDQSVTIHMPVQVLNKITLNSPTKLSIEGELKMEDFALVVNGLGTYSESHLRLDCQSVLLYAFGHNSGSHTLEGRTENLRVIMEGLAWADAVKLQSSKAIIYQRSLKSSYLQVADELTINMYSSGNVYFYGKPDVIYQTVEQDWDVDFGNAINRPN